MRYDLNPPILCGEFPRHIQGIIGRRVVDDKNAEVLNILPQCARHTIAQESSKLITWNCDVDARHGAPCGLLPVMSTESGSSRMSAKKEAAHIRGGYVFVTPAHSHVMLELGHPADKLTDRCIMSERSRLGISFRMSL